MAHEHFSCLNSEIGISIALVFRSDAAIKTAELPWPSQMVHFADSRIRNGEPFPPTRKFYLYGSLNAGGNTLTFGFKTLPLEMEKLEVSEDKAELTLWQREGLATCARAGEGKLWGFGLPHPTNPKFRPNMEYAGPLTDHRPGQRADWSFKPVFVGVRPRWGGKPYALEIVTSWSRDAVNVVYERGPSVMPPELREYLREIPRNTRPVYTEEFPQRMGKPVAN